MLPKLDVVGGERVAVLVEEMALPVALVDGAEGPAPWEWKSANCVDLRSLLNSGEPICCRKRASAPGCRAGRSLLGCCAWMTSACCSFVLGVVLLREGTSFCRRLRLSHQV